MTLLLAGRTEVTVWVSTAVVTSVIYNMTTRVTKSMHHAERWKQRTRVVTSKSTMMVENSVAFVTALTRVGLGSIRVATRTWLSDQTRRKSSSHGY